MKKSIFLVEVEVEDALLLYNTMTYALMELDNAEKMYCRKCRRAVLLGRHATKNCMRLLCKWDFW